MGERPCGKAEVVLAFSRRLVAARRHAGLSQEALAHRAGLHRTYIGNIEQGLVNPTLWSLACLAAGLGLTLGELMEGADP